MLRKCPSRGLAGGICIQEIEAPYMVETDLETHPFCYDMGSHAGAMQKDCREYYIGRGIFQLGGKEIGPGLPMSGQQALDRLSGVPDRESNKSPVRLRKAHGRPTSKTGGSST